MAMQNFANRGQVVQVTCVIIGTVLALYAGLMKSDISPIWIVVLCIFGIGLIVSILNLYVGWSKSAKADSEPDRGAPIPVASSPAIEIVNPWDREHVDFKRFVYGRTAHPGVSIQVFVHAGDDAWHPQDAPEVYGNKWRSRCQFGSLTSPAESRFKLVAVLGAKPVKGAVSDLPSGVAQSQEVIVFRSANPAPSPTNQSIRPGFGVNWDDRLQPICPICRASLSLAVGDDQTLHCINHHGPFRLVSYEGISMTLTRAREYLLENPNKRQ